MCAREFFRYWRLLIDRLLCRASNGLLDCLHRATKQVCGDGAAAIMNEILRRRAGLTDTFMRRLNVKVRE